MLQIGRKHQQSAVCHSNHDLVRILCTKLHDGRPDNAALASRVMEVYAICTRVYSYVVDAAQEIVRMAMGLVHCASGENRGPAAGDFESLLTDLQKSQNTAGRTSNARTELLKFFTIVQCLFRLPPLTGLERFQTHSQCSKRRQTLAFIESRNAALS